MFVLHHARSRFVALATLVLVAGAALIWLPPAKAEAVPITGGALTWGVKASFRNYVQGPIALGNIQTHDGASKNPDGTFNFPFTAGRHLRLGSKRTRRAARRGA